MQCVSLWLFQFNWSETKGNTWTSSRESKTIMNHTNFCLILHIPLYYIVYINLYIGYLLNPIKVCHFEKNTASIIDYYYGKILNKRWLDVQVLIVQALDTNISVLHLTVPYFFTFRYPILYSLWPGAILFVSLSLLDLSLSESAGSHQEQSLTNREFCAGSYYPWVGPGQARFGKTQTEYKPNSGKNRFSNPPMLVRATALGPDQNGRVLF